MKKWLLADLHIHSTFSDGSMPVEEIVKIYGEAGFDVIAITDHLFDTQSPRSLEIHEEGKSIKDVEAYFQKIEEVSQWAKQTFGLLVIPGLEICNLSEDYHILGIDLKEGVNPNQDAEGVIKEIHRQGGLAIASHPHLKLSYFLQGDTLSIQRHPLHLWKYRGRYVGKIDAWEIANREDLFPIIGLERYPFLASSDFHERHHLTSWKSLILAEKDKEDVKKAIIEKSVSLFFFRDGIESSIPPQIENREAFGETIMDDEKDWEGPGKAKILIADDERDLVEMLSYNLQKKGYKTINAYDGFEAWERIESENPDLLILDLMMPGIDGWELCRLIRRSQKKEINEMGILMLTARAMPEDKVYGLELGADDYLTKPFSLHELILRVGNIVNKKNSIHGLNEEVDHLRFEITNTEKNLRRVVHDLKNHLLSMGISAKLLLRRRKKEEKLRFTTNIYENSLRLTRWVEDILRFYDLSSQGLKYEMKEVEIQSMVEQAVDLLRDLGKKKEIEILFHSSPPVLSIQCSEPLLQRALDNLISNALKYTPNGGSVEVSVIPYSRKDDEGIVEISVRDTGIGIREEDMERIFEPFYRGKNSLSENGLGLGLSFTKEVVDLHRGRILVHSEPNKGSTFSILLPVKGNFKAEEMERGHGII
ncbi:MAG: ATP-binding protein [Thermodesulfobacteriota bacterium]|jgi:signal transduction histidine kinase/histidinol phosphatase-like PHP family hydrolase